MRDAILLLETVAFTVLVPGTVTVWIPRHFFGLGVHAVPSAPGGARQVVAAALLVAGAIVYVRCVWDFAARGRGIPAPVDHPRQLVVTGLYRYVRNPMYLGVLFVLLGEVLLVPSLPFGLYIVGWCLLVEAFVVLHEEPALTRKFGEAYVHYLSAVRRWIPGRRYQPPS